MSGKGIGGPVPNRKGEYDSETKRWEVIKARLARDVKEYGWMHEVPTEDEISLYLAMDAMTGDDDFAEGDPNDPENRTLFGESYGDEDRRLGGWE